MRVIYLSTLTKLPYPAVVEETTVCVLEKKTLDHLCRIKESEIYPLTIHKGLVMTHAGQLLAIAPDGKEGDCLEEIKKQFIFFATPCQHSIYRHQEEEHQIKLERIKIQ